MLSDCGRWGCNLLDMRTHRASFLYEGDSGREQSGMFLPEARLLPVGLRQKAQETEDHFREGGFKVRLAWGPRAHSCFFLQLWFVYFDLENCVQFLSEHVREMKTSQEVRYLK